jgi:RNA polymerase sigma-70 factor (ECF subfamily)
LDDGGTPAHARALASHHGFVRELARGLVAPDSFEDVAHEALLAGLARPPQRPAALRSWLATTVRRLAGKWRRGEARRARREGVAARPEALPSARDLVERVELEQAVVRAVLSLKEPFRTTVLLRFYEGHATAAIAEQLQLPADTVRARLRRGLAELRAQLDARFGARSEWVAALLPVAALPTGVAATGTVGAGASAAVKAAAAVATTGAAVMSVKTIGAVVASCATVAFAWWAVPESWLERALSTGTTSSAARELGAAEGAGAARVAAAGVPVDALAPTRSAEGAAGPAGAAADAVAGDASLPPPGTVLLEVVDARTLTCIESVKIRFLNDARFAEYDGSGSVQTVLTAGHWEASVAAVGYEPARLADFDVAVSEARALGRIALERGNGVVEGRVVARHLPGDAPVSVELFGDGRSPCDTCLAAANGSNGAGEGDDAERAQKLGADCGYRADRDAFAATGDRAFRFAHLAAGVYWLRASDPQQRIVESRRIEVGRGGYAWQELDVSAPTFARFELRHERGGLFTGAWASPHRPLPAPIHYEFRRGGQPVGAVEFTPSADDTLASVGAPIVIPSGERAPSDLESAVSALEVFEIHSYDHLILAEVAVNFTTEQKLSWFRRVEATADLPMLERLDRDRREGDGLHFDFAEPGCDGVAVTLQPLRPDLHEVRPLPRLELTVVVTCGEYSSDEVALDLRADWFQPICVTMRPQPQTAGALPAAQAQTRAMCASCHTDPAAQRQDLDVSGFWKTRRAQVDFAEIERIDASVSHARTEKP